MSENSFDKLSTNGVICVLYFCHLERKYKSAMSYQKSKDKIINVDLVMLQYKINSYIIVLISNEGRLVVL